VSTTGVAGLHAVRAHWPGTRRAEGRRRLRRSPVHPRPRAGHSRRREPSGGAISAAALTNEAKNGDRWPRSVELEQRIERTIQPIVDKFGRFAAIRSKLAKLDRVTPQRRVKLAPLGGPSGRE